MSGISALQTLSFKACLSIFLLSLLKLYLCYYLVKKIERIHVVTESLRRYSPFFDIFTSLPLRTIRECGLNSLFWLFLFFCANAILFSGQFFAQKSSFMATLVFFQLSLLFLRGPWHPETLVKKAVENTPPLLATLISVYAIEIHLENGGPALFRLAVFFLAGITVLVIINRRSFFLNNLEEILWSVLLINYITYSITHHFGHGAWVAELWGFALLALKGMWSAYKFDSFHPREIRRSDAFVLSIILVFLVKSNGQLW